MEHECVHEADWGKLWQLMKTHTDHVIEGDRPTTGYRDRLLRAELDIEAMKKAQWYRAITAGVVGGLIGSGSRDVINMLINWVIGR